MAARSMAPAAPPYVGVAYYPEAAGGQIGRDVARMREVGINLVRLGEFAWSRLEPREGVYEFGWLHEAVALCAEAGLAVVLCTPSATPPVWLSSAHPEILRVNALGLRVGHGGRRQYCPNSACYREYAAGITARLASEFGDHPSVVAWQLDNEFWEECYCANCEQAFQAWLAARFGSVERLNEAWLTVLWSQEYQSFDQVPLPNPHRVGSGHHPSLRVAYRRFFSDSYVSFAEEQAAVLRRGTRAAVTTNGHSPAAQQIDYTDLFRHLDLVGTDSYAGPDNLLRYAFECDWMRPLGKPFWLMETASTYSAGTAVSPEGLFVHQPGALRAKMWLTYALGGEAVNFWHWRGHWAGQELEHGSLLYPWGEECANTPEVRTVAAELASHAEWLRTTRPRPAAAALHYGLRSQWQYEVSPIVGGFRYESAITAFHRLLAEEGVRCDLLMGEADLSGYSLVYSPYLPSLAPAALEQLRAWVEAGGTWVLGPLSACRTEEATGHRDACYGRELEDWLGVHVRHRMPPGAVTTLVTDGGESLACRLWCDAYEVADDGGVEARYAGGPLDGLAAVVERSLGQGRVLLLGTLPDESWLRPRLRRLAPAADADPGVLVVERVQPDGRSAGLIAVNTQPKAARFRRPDGAQLTLDGFGAALCPE